MKAVTFDLESGERMEVEIVSGPSSTGLYVLQTKEGKKITRHKDRIEVLHG